MQPRKTSQAKQFDTALALYPWVGAFIGIILFWAIFTMIGVSDSRPSTNLLKEFIFPPEMFFQKHMTFALWVGGIVGFWSGCGFFVKSRDSIITKVLNREGSRVAFFIAGITFVCIVLIFARDRSNPSWGVVTTT